MTEAHTPGPWWVRLYPGTHSYEVRAAGSSLIAVVGNLGATSDHAPSARRWKEETPANAHLISAAPDLLEALQAFNVAVEAGEGTVVVRMPAAVVTQVAAAIAKATNPVSPIERLTPESSTTVGMDVAPDETGDAGRRRKPHGWGIVDRWTGNRLTARRSTNRCWSIFPAAGSPCERP